MAVAAKMSRIKTTSPGTAATTTPTATAPTAPILRRGHLQGVP